MTRARTLLWRLLTAALLLTPALLPALAPELEPFFRAIRQKESAGHPWSIFDNTTHKSYRLASRTEAEQLARELVARGHNLDLGLFQLNWHWQGRRPTLTLDNVFDPAVNEAIARTVFAEFYAAARAIHASTDDAIRMAVGAYNNGKVRVHNPGYVNGVFRLAGLTPPYATTGATSPRITAAENRTARDYRTQRDDGDNVAQAPAFRLPAGIVALLDETDTAFEAPMNWLSADTLLQTLLPLLLALVAVVALIVFALLGLKLLPWLLLSAGTTAKRALLIAALRAQQRLASQTARLAQGR